MLIGATMAVAAILFLLVAISTNREINAASERIDEWIRQHIDIRLIALASMILMLAWLLADGYDRAHGHHAHPPGNHSAAAPSP